MAFAEASRPSTTPQSERIARIAAAARALLDTEGPDGLSMRRLAERLGVTAPALYRYFPDKRSLQDDVISSALVEVGDLGWAALDEARRTGDDPLLAVWLAYRAWGIAHPHLYRLVYTSPLDDDRRDAGPVEHGAACIRAACGGDAWRARRSWVYVHGLVMLELDDRLTTGYDPVDLLRQGLAQLN